MFKFVPATYEHTEELSKNLREYEKKELDVMTLKANEIALQNSVDSSIEAWTWLEDDKVVGIVGISVPSVLSDKAYPWFMCSNLINKNGKSLIKATRVALNYWLQTYEELESYIDARHDKALKWVKICGFTIHEPVPYGPYGNPFCKITIKRK